jgi:hypothetical protein
LKNEKETMGFSEMSDEEKKRMTGEGNFCCTSIFSCIAFICGLYAAWNCSFLEREVVLSDDFLTNCEAADIPEDVCNALTLKHGIGFYGFEVTVPIDETICLDYTQYIDGAS